MTNRKGFTLIELLVVIAIIGILSAVGLIALNGAREKARDSQRKSDLGQIRTGLALYYDTHNNYPGTANTWYSFNGTSAAGNMLYDALISTVGGGAYISRLPSTPNQGKAGSEWYSYCTLNASNFGLYATLERPAAAGGLWVVNSATGTAAEAAVAACP